jgi:hypothetical protein
MIKLTQQEFWDALEKGKGRVFLHLQENGPAGFQEEILQACLHNLVYDAQCEDSRANWLMSIIDMTGDEAFFRKRILDALPNSMDFRDIDQLMDLATCFYRRGCSEARQAIYEKFDKQDFNESWLGGEQILSMDGVEGMLHVAEVIGRRMVVDPKFWEDGLFSQACSRLGKEVMMTAFENEAKKSPNVKAYLEAATVKKPGTIPNSRANQSLEKILADIEAASGEYPGHYTFFGKRANAKDLDVLFGRFLLESRREQLSEVSMAFPPSFYAHFKQAVVPTGRIGGRKTSERCHCRLGTNSGSINPGFCDSFTSPAPEGHRPGSHHPVYSELFDRRP